MTKIWDNERHSVTERKDLRQRLDTLRGELEQAKRVGNLERASRLQYGDIPEATQRLATLDEASKAHRTDPSAMVSDAVRSADIAQACAVVVYVFGC